MRAIEINQLISGLRRDAQAALDFVLSQPRLAVSPVVRWPACLSFFIMFEI